MKIVFFGTPEFAVGTLSAILKAGHTVAAVVTAPDKPKGRGQQIAESDVKVFAKEQGLVVLQPEKLKAPEFIEELNAINADLFVVVAFRMMPEVIWNMPPKGTINLHASLLPNYRGAAPINWAIINGEKETGVTTFFISHQIDTGDLIYQEPVAINEDDNAGTLHDKLMVTGANLIVRTLSDIEKGTNPSIPQKDIINGDLKHAPKLFKPDCLLHWNKTSQELYNQIRGLSPYPAAYTELIDEKGTSIQLKLFEVALSKQKVTAGEVLSDCKTYFSIGTSDGSLLLKDVQLAGKKRMKTDEFLRGFRWNGILKAYKN